MSLPALAGAAGPVRSSRIGALDRMMVELRPQSSRASRTIRETYREHLNLLVLDGFADLEGALANGGLARLPADPLRFNLSPRLDGPSPIGEKDLENQDGYIAARPATVGCLLEVARRVKSGPLEITSLVRHSEYQEALRATNGNARTSVPMHTMGLAFDIALVNTPLETVYEIRNVLRKMSRSGDLLFIGERRQLVFHVVPHPSRLGHFTQVYARALRGDPSSGPPVVELSSARDPYTALATPAVSAEVIAVLPAREFAEEWWAVSDAPGDIRIRVTPERADMPVTTGDEPAASPVAAGTLLMIITGALAVARRFASRRSSVLSASLHQVPSRVHGETSAGTV